MTDVHARSFPARHYSTSSIATSPFRSPTFHGNMHRPSPGIQALDLHPTAQLDIPSALSSLRIHVLSYLSDLEARLALLDFKSQSLGTTRPSSPAPLLSPSKLPSPLITTLSEPTISHSSSLLEDVVVEATVAGLAPVHDDDEDSEATETNELDLDSDDVAAFIQQGFELLRTIRAEVYSYLPDVHVHVDFDFPAVAAEAMQQKRDALRNRITEFGRNHIPNSPRHQLQGLLGDKLLPDFAEKFDFSDVVHNNMPSMDALRSKLSDLTPDSLSMGTAMNSALDYVPRLKDHLASLQAHMQSIPFQVSSSAAAAAMFPYLPGGGLSAPMPKILTELLADLLQEDTEEAIQADIQKEKQNVKSAHVEIRRALEKSENGATLIRFDDLPAKWRNNQWVKGGYRFVPSSNWPALLLSVFRMHNETTNIHTHLLPLLTVLPILATYISAYILPASFAALLPTPLASLSSISTFNPSWFSSVTSTISSIPLFSYIPALLPHDATLDPLPASFFTFSAAMCLLSSVTWHVLAGCSDLVVMESAARGDYVGIGWLISASVQTVVFYGFNCQTTELRLYTALCLLTGFAGSVVPFMSWFNERRNKKWRIVFFLGLCFASLLPLTHLGIAKGPINTLIYVVPILKSCSLYIIGLIFYATHFPESSSLFKGMDIPFFEAVCSHALWHVFIVLAIRSHYVGLGQLKALSGEFSCGL